MTNTTVSTEEMARLPIFAGMSAKEIEQLAKIAEIKSYRPDEVILDQGQNSQNLWVILEGKCQVVKLAGADNSHTVDLADLGPRDHFGEMSFFHAAPHSASVKAQTTVRVLRISRTDFDRLVELGCAAAYHLALNSVEQLADRLRRMDDWVTDLVANMNDNHQTEHEWSRFRDKLFSLATT